MADSANEDDAFEALCYSDRGSMLFGLLDANWSGPCSAEEADYSSSLSELIGCFHAAQKRAAARCDAGVWSDDKAIRKERWIALGVPVKLLVPTLHTCTFVADATPPPDAEPEFSEDDDGAWVPCYAPSELLMPIDPSCELRLQALLTHHRRLVLKPSRGSNSAGVLCLSVDASEPLRNVPQASGEPRLRLILPPQLPEQHLWAFEPNKALAVINEYESVRVVRRAEWFHELILTQAQYLFRSVGGEAERTLVVESQVPYDQELCCLVVNGGRVQVLAGRANCMERLLMLEGHETMVRVDALEVALACSARVRRPARCVLRP